MATNIHNPFTINSQVLYKASGIGIQRPNKESRWVPATITEMRTDGPKPVADLRLVTGKIVEDVDVAELKPANSDKTGTSTSSSKITTAFKRGESVRVMGAIGTGQDRRSALSATFLGIDTETGGAVLNFKDQQILQPLKAIAWPRNEIIKKTNSKDPAIQKQARLQLKHWFPIDYECIVSNHQEIADPNISLDRLMAFKNHSPYPSVQETAEANFILRTELNRMTDPKEIQKKFLAHSNPLVQRFAEARISQLKASPRVTSQVNWSKKVQYYSLVPKLPPVTEN